jgi:hypothetical protein
MIVEKPGLDIYTWFDGYVAWLKARGMQGGTVINRISVAKKWFKTESVCVSKEKFHDDW